jgi:pectin methylesterase-like acyl-CoA thioesterase
VVERSCTMVQGARFRWVGCLFVCCMPACGNSDANPGSAAVGGSGAFGTGGSVPAVGGTLSAAGGAQASSTGGSSDLGGANSGGATASGGTSASTGGRTGQGGASVGGAPAGGASTGGAHTGGTSVGGSGAGGSTTGGTSAGNATGGKATGGGGAGGKAAGGASSGGATTGGSVAAGAGTGGANRGGASNGGAGTGGKASGGAAIGGAPVGGSSGSSSLCPAGITQTIAVAKDGSGQYTTLQAAINSIASGSSTHIRINIKAGTYPEKVTIASRTNLCLVGDSATTTTLTYNDSNAGVGSTSGSASVFVSANDFSAAQLTFANSYGSGSQAVALRTTGQRQQFLDCRFVGYQDTLYVHSGTQYFRNCYVQGNTDYVFGGATAILQNCEVRNVEKGSAVAAPNTDSTTAYGIVFLGGQFTAASGISGVALARPWGADGAAAFLNATLGAHISTAGFTSMSGNDPANARFGEYQSTGAGANASSRSSYQMTSSQAAKYTIANIYGGAWTPSYSQ